MRVSTSLIVIVGAALLAGMPSVARAQEAAPGIAEAAPAQQPAPPEPTPRHTGVHAMLKELVVDFKTCRRRKTFTGRRAAAGSPPRSSS